MKAQKNDNKTNMSVPKLCLGISLIIFGIVFIFTWPSIFESLLEKVSLLRNTLVKANLTLNFHDSNFNFVQVPFHINFGQNLLSQSTWIFIFSIGQIPMTSQTSLRNQYSKKSARTGFRNSPKK
jgi:hypothetical protein